MLAVAQPLPHQLNGQSSAEDSSSFRPLKDIDAFKQHLPPPIEFVQGSSTGAVAVPSDKYECINDTPPTDKPGASSEKAPESAPPSPKLSRKAKPASSRVAPSLHAEPIDISWPDNVNGVGAGLFNTGNTCFMNSALQCLFHTPPLLRLLSAHSKDTCKSLGFCMTCCMKYTAMRSQSSNKSAFNPDGITRNLKAFAKSLRYGRQEDSHEFLRHAIEGLQRSCLAGQPQKVDPKLAETSWVHQLFGGQLRSRVHCKGCGHNSDTYDSILDLSLDIHRTSSLKDALKSFVAPDYLKGSDKYKCDHCKKYVNAEKRFTINKAPLVLTIHLKRFSPFGSKLTNLLHYDEHITLKPYMSEGSFGPRYSLYGVICHSGSGPNSGHYYSFVKSKQGRWYEMNDESVTPCSKPYPMLKTAYMLMYIQDKGQNLDAAIHSTGAPSLARTTLSSGMKRKEREEPSAEAQEDDLGEQVEQPFIGPELPPHLKREVPSPAKRLKVEESAEKVDVKKEAKEKPSALGDALAGYGSDDDDDSSKPASTPATPAAKTGSGATVSPIPTSSFYASSASASKKRKSTDTAPDEKPAKKNSTAAFLNNPFSSRLTSKPGGLTTYGKKNRRMRGI